MEVHRHVRGLMAARKAHGGGVGRFLGNLVLNLAAIGGAICLVLVVLAFFFNINLIMFKTGSMSPTIPAGSVALVHQIPASDVAVRDVLTVQRAGKLPVTHRVVDIEPGHDAGTRTIRMKGDANENEDPEPYTITGGARVLGHVPGLANTIVWFSNPWVLGGLTLAAGSFVTLAFWPRRRPEEEVSTESMPVVVGTGGPGAGNPEAKN